MTTTKKPVVKRGREKKIKKDLVTTKTGVNIAEAYCRKCMSIKPVREFMSATDSWIDANGIMSVCRDCIDDIYEKIYNSEKSIEKTLLKMCRMFNLVYDNEAIESTLKHLKTAEDNGRTIRGIFGIYKQKIYALQPMEIGHRPETQDLTYKDVVTLVIHDENKYGLDKDVEYEVTRFWGKGLRREDYIWLEESLADWKKTHKSDTMAEQTLLKEIVYKQFEITKAREEGKSTSSMVKELQELMKTASIDPAKTAIAGSGKSQDTFSSFIKMIEENEPAELFGEERDAFKDFQNIDFYFRKYVTRPLKNFVTGSRDFNIDEEDDEIENDDIEETYTEIKDEFSDFDDKNQSSQIDESENLGE